MEYRKLGRTGIDVSIIGLGAEYLEYAPKDTVVSVVNEAVDNGVNYIDLFMASPNVRDNFGIALKDRRHKVMVAGHLGAVLINDQYSKTRDNALAESYVNDLLTRLQTDYIDVLMLHFVDEPDDYESVFGPKGLLELALSLKKEGKARFIGLSGHYVPTALKAVNSGKIDVLLFPVNAAFDILPADMDMDTMRQDNSYNEVETTDDTSILQRRELYHACVIQDVGLVAMKIYAAGRLFVKDNPSNILLTPVQCINYVLSQPGVCTVVPGCKNVPEMKAALAFLDATDKEKDYSSIDINSVWKLAGSCMYCNHCLPCPVSIDIGMVSRITDTAKYGMTESVLSEYEALLAKASDCTECGVCAERCPFKVDVITNMMQAVDIFGK
ncbi:MAG: aldo/keto reductase [Dehalococcoidales bacterium]|nr:aldo/keto reductase [Dehalococcoidales bacterium]